MRPLKTICVFAGSSPGGDSAYKRAAVMFARTVVERDLRIVYGGANVGLMGTIADACLEHGGEVIGVIPEFLLDKEVAHQGLTELRVVRSMHERKQLMADLSDAFVALPGGIGTFEEFFEVFTWAQLGLHKKPFGILNVRDFYTPLIEFLDHAVNSRFVKPEHRAMLQMSDEATSLIDKLITSEWSDVEKWIERATT